MDIKIGTRIKELRKRKNITQEQLAEALGVTNQAISKWESGNGYPDIAYIVPIAKYFDVSADYLLGNMLVKLLEVGDKNNGVQCNCSFCGKRNDQILTLISGPNDIYICNECVGLCVDTLINNRF
ncbi:MAG: helix-turn-helix domain-containing protein [Defluviitaleaceae bacterium]|nr:helix-turn-helix domain-containing protein [Defluviitaleaceae bacterium]